MVKSSCANYVSRTHDVIDDVSRSQSRSNLEIAICPSIFQLDRRPKAQNIRNAHGCHAGIFNFWYYIWKKGCRHLQMAAILKILKYYTQFHFDFRYEKIVPNHALKVFFMVMTSSMTSQVGLKVGLLYSFINEIRFFMIIKKRTKISLNIRSQSRSNIEIAIFPSIFQLEHRSKAQNIGNAHGYFVGIFNFRYCFRYKSLSRPQNGGYLEISNTALISPQILEGRPKLCQKCVFHGDDFTGWPESCPLYWCLGEVRSGSNLQGLGLVNTCECRNCLLRLYLPKKDFNK